MKITANFQLKVFGSQTLSDDIWSEENDWKSGKERNAKHTRAFATKEGTLKYTPDNQSPIRTVWSNIQIFLRYFIALYLES